jgi:A/G-specific adenine glycosylase
LRIVDIGNPTRVESISNLNSKIYTPMPSLADQILDWYILHARQLPWRGHPDPYAVWVSEVMLQQTRVETVIPYFERWMAHFPTLESLAEASLEDVLSRWEGLGYYSRARNLHRAARIVMEDYGGELPQDAKSLRRLPGIGRYTAGAIASIAFGRDEPTLDGNIRRVLARLFDIRLLAGSPESENLLWTLAAMHLPPGKAGTFNQALMELGALICTPVPQCERCPLSGDCQARTLGVQVEQPVRVRRARVPHYNVTAAVIRREGQVLIGKRPLDGLLGGLWEFPGGKLEPGEQPESGLRREIREELGVEVEIGQSLGVYRHAYTHFRVTVQAFYCDLHAGEPRRLHHAALAWSDLRSLRDYPMGKVDRLIAERLTRNIVQPSVTSSSDHGILKTDHAAQC